LDNWVENYRNCRSNLDAANYKHVMLGRSNTKASSIDSCTLNQSISAYVRARPAADER